MAAISSISNGEALSSVRTKLNSVITEVNLLDPTDWVDYSATSTIVGWSSTPTKIIKYRIIGKQMFVYFNLQGTSNSTTTTFTLPVNNVFGNSVSFLALAVDNGITTGAGNSYILDSTNIVILRKDQIGNSFTNSGTKQAFGEFFIQIA